jgi:hypothetical protein
MIRPTPVHRPVWDAVYRDVQGPVWLNGAGGASAIDLTTTGTLLVDFTRQPITATAVTYGGPGSGATVINDGAFGSYSVTRNVINHETQLFGGSSVSTITLTADGWEMVNSGSTTPTVAREFRPAVNFSKDMDFTNVASLTYEWGFPVAGAPDLNQGVGVGTRPYVMDGSAFFWPGNMITVQAVLKSEKMLTRFNCGALGASGWTLQSGTPLWNGITQIQARINVINTNGGTKFVLRRIWANLKQGKAKIAFNFDDLLTTHYTNALPVLNAVGAKGGLAASTASIDTSDPDYSYNPSVFMTEAQMLDLYTTYGWSIYPHMRSHDPALALGLTFVSYTAGAPNLTRYSVATQRGINDLSAAITAGGGLGVYTVSIRGAWGPEYNGSHVVNAIDTVGKTFDVVMGATAPAATVASLLGDIRMDWPNTTREALMVAELDPCIDYLETTLGAGFRGRNIFTVPRGDYDPSYKADLESRGFVAARSTRSYVTATAASQTASASAPLYKTSTTTVSGTVCMPGWFDQWDIRIIQLDGLAYSRVAEVLAIIDDAVAHGQFICFLSHYVTAGVTPATNTTSLEVLTDVANYCGTLRDSGDLEFVTLEQIVAAVT